MTKPPACSEGQSTETYNQVSVSPRLAPGKRGKEVGPLFAQIVPYKDATVDLQSHSLNRLLIIKCHSKTSIHLSGQKGKGLS